MVYVPLIVSAVSYTYALERIVRGSQLVRMHAWHNVQEKFDIASDTRVAAMS
jgi:hypothetical protein